MKNSNRSGKFNVISLIDGAKDTEETGEEGRDQTRCTNPLNPLHREPTTMCNT